MSLTKPQLLVARFLLAAAVGVITYLATTKTTSLAVFTIWDKANHLVAFLALGFLSDFAFPGTGTWWRKPSAVLFYGFLIETVQYFLPYRSFDLWDLGADAAGLVAYGAIRPVLRRMPVLRRRWTPD